jgi:hypothetical protein
MGFATPAGAGVCPEWIEEFPVNAANLELLTSPTVLNHLPGPTPQDFGDGLIGTADDGIQDAPSILGAPNDLGRAKTGLPGSPDTKLLHGMSIIDSQESSLHAPGSDNLSLAKTGEGAFSYVKFSMGEFETLSYLGGGVSAVPEDLRFTLQGGKFPFNAGQVTLGGTTVALGGFFQGPFNIDLVTISPGEDLSFSWVNSTDNTSESIVQGCNGLARGVDGLDPVGQPIDWQPLDPGLFPKFPRIGVSNEGEWNPKSAKPLSPDGRTIFVVVDMVVKVPRSGLFFVAQEVRLAGYGFPLGEAGGLLNPNFHPDGDLPDIPGFPSSGKGLARYLHDVIVPIADEQDALLLGLLRGVATVELIGVPTTLDFTLVATGNFGSFDLCALDVTPCSF